MRARERERDDGGRLIGVAGNEGVESYVLLPRIFPTGQPFGGPPLSVLFSGSLRAKYVSLSSEPPLGKHLIVWVIQAVDKKNNIVARREFGFQTNSAELVNNILNYPT